MKRISLFLVAIALLLVSQTTVTAQDADWRGEYFNNIYLLGDAQIVESNAISFDWGSSAPIAGINDDNFSIRWIGWATFSGGTYRFFVRADDEIRLRVDNQIYIDTFGKNQVGDVVSADIPLNSGRHQLHIDYREKTGNAYAFVTWANVASNPVVPNFATVQRVTTTAVNLGNWIAQYYGNKELSGLPTAILSENAISNDWGKGSPVASVPSDNFSARWTNSTNFERGTYRFTLRADDGVRMFVDGNLQLDHWRDSEGKMGSIDLILSEGLHNITIEYYEETSDAYIEFSINRIDQTTTIPTQIPAALITGSSNIAPVNTGALGTVVTYRLNVRETPTTDSDVLVKIERGETYPIVGRTEQNDWWQIDVNGTLGWVFGDFLVVSNTGNVPITGEDGLPQDLVMTGFRLTALSTINLRSLPSTRGAVLGVLSRGATADIIGRNSTGTWIKIYYGRKIAWVSRSFVQLEGVSVNNLPIVP